MWACTTACPFLQTGIARIPRTHGEPHYPGPDPHTFWFVMGHSRLVNRPLITFLSSGERTHCQYQLPCALPLFYYYFLAADYSPGNGVLAVFAPYDADALNWVAAGGRTGRHYRGENGRIRFGPAAPAFLFTPAHSYHAAQYQIVTTQHRRAMAGAPL